MRIPKMSKSNSVTDKTLSEAGVKKGERRLAKGNMTTGQLAQYKWKRASQAERGGKPTDTSFKAASRFGIPDEPSHGGSKGIGRGGRRSSQRQLKGKLDRQRMERERKTGVNSSILPFVGMTLSEAGISRDVAARFNPARLAGKAAGAIGRAKSRTGEIVGSAERVGRDVAGRVAQGARHIVGIPGKAIRRAGRALRGDYQTARGDTGGGYRAEREKALGRGRQDTSILPFVGMTLSEIFTPAQLAIRNRSFETQRAHARNPKAKLTPKGRKTTLAGAVPGGTGDTLRRRIRHPRSAWSRIHPSTPERMPREPADPVFPPGERKRRSRETTAAIRAATNDSILPFVGMTLSEVYSLVEKRYDDEGNPIPAHKRSFAVGTKMAEREFKDPTTAKANKARREKLKKAGHGSVSAGMAHRSKELRRERAKKDKK